jgi:pyruvate dehydrogenase E1 component alpha subunit
MSFSTEKSMKVDHIAERAVAYGIPGVTVEGNDVDAVYAAAQEAVDRARRGDGPTLVENITYRWKGHSKSDKNLYRSKEEIDDWKALDPIVAFENKVESAGVLNREEIEKIQNDMRDQIRVAIQEATQAPDSDPAELLASVFRQVNS